MKIIHQGATIALITTALMISAAGAVAQEPPTNLYWGDTHLHSSYSVDAYLLGNKTADPDTAYRWAKGLPVVHPYHQARIRIQRPLDFLVVADHAEYLGVMPKLFSGDPEIAATDVGKRVLGLVKEGKGRSFFMEVINSVNNNQPIEELNSNELRKSFWNDITAAADHHNEPGKFTSLIGWEWSSLPDGANLHRVVFTPQDSEVANRFIPYSMFESQKPEDLWNWLDQTSRDTGAEFVAIPHNSNISKGLMFAENDSNGRPISSEYARMRMRWEPVVEVAQIKGDSETHPQLSPDDAFADFETYDHTIETGNEGKDKAANAADYVRSGLMRGLEIDAKAGANPYKVGMVGSTDAHTGIASAEEDNFWGKAGIDSIPANKANQVTPGANGYDMSAAGLAAVWATENTRQAITAAFKRKETFASTGPRMRVRFFGGFDFDAADAIANDLASRGYGKGVPMGGDLTQAPAGKAPQFLVQAVKDPQGANLDRVQIIKGWLGNDGRAREKVYNVAWSDQRQLDADGRLTALASTVDLKTANYTNSRGQAQLATVWTDPEFDTRQRAFYYARVLQIATPRHSLYDTLAQGLEPEASGHPAVIQERAYTSSIWYTP